MLCANPDASIAIFQERANAVVDQPILRSEVVEAASIQMAYSVIGSDPHASISRFQKNAHKVVHQPIACSEMLRSLCGEMIDAASVSSNPKRSIAIA
jgi:hypothetical protein